MVLLPPLKIAFYYAYPRPDWGWNDENLETGLGGTETALAYMARTLARSHAVTVFNWTEREGIFHGVRYAHLDHFDCRETWDAFIGMRGPIPGLEAIPARVKVYWSIEEDDVLVGDWGRVLPHVRAIFTISPFHTAELLRRCRIPPDKVHQTFLGAWAEDYLVPLPKVPAKLLYCSVPALGLHHLVEIFPRVRAAVPHASLAITGDFTLWGRGPEDEALRAAFAGMPGVIYLGRIPRSRLVEEQKTSQLHVYPCSVPELFCLASIECQAAGTPTVGTTLGALSSTVSDGYSGVLIRTPVDHPDFHSHFAAAVIDLLSDPDRLAVLARQARERALREYTYERVADEWIDLFRQWMA